MPKKIVFAVCGVLILALSVMLNNAHAIRFEGNAWVAHHIEDGEYTSDYFFIIDPNSIEIDPNSVILKKFEITPISDGLDFSEIATGGELLWFEIENFENINNYNFKFRDTEGSNYTGKAQFTNFNNPVDSPSAVPEPATILLIGSGLLGLAGIGRKKFKKIK